MTHPDIRQELTEFLECDEDFILCIKGDWGAGKTHFWKQILAESKLKKIKKPSYSYVSLFGINNIDELKSAIVSNIEILDEPKIEETIRTRIDNIRNNIRNFAQRNTKYAKIIPHLKEFQSAISMFGWYSISNLVICFDDIERRGKDLSIREVFGIANFMREQKSSRLVFILNHNAMSDDHDELIKHSEKTIDQQLSFETSTKFALDVGVQKTHRFVDTIRENCEKLDLRNIRTIRRIDRSCDKVVLLLDKFHDDVVKSAISSIVLLTAVTDSTIRIPINFVVRRDDDMDLEDIFNEVDEHSESKEEKVWRVKLREYGYLSTNDLDMELYLGIIKGYFDKEKIVECAGKIQDGINRSQSLESFEEAWSTYHNSFESNENDAIDAISSSFKQNVNVVTPLNLNGTVKFLKYFDRNELAMELIDFYVSERDDLYGSFDLEEYAFNDEITEQEVRQALTDKFQDATNNRDPVVLLKSLRTGSGYSKRDLEYLASLDIEYYYRIFKENSGSELRKIIRGSLFFRGVQGVGDTEKQIVARATEALRQIASESRINQRRVMNFGIALE